MESCKSLMLQYMPTIRIVLDSKNCMISFICTNVDEVSGLASLSSYTFSLLSI